MNIQNVIEEHRRLIDAVDDEIARLLVNRATISAEIGRFKRENAILGYDERREHAIVDRLVRRPDGLGELSAAQLEELYAAIFRVMHVVQARTEHKRVPWQIERRGKFALLKEGDLILLVVDTGQDEAVRKIAERHNGIIENG